METLTTIDLKNRNQVLYCKVLTHDNAKKNIIFIHDYFDYHKRYLDMAKMFSDKLKANICVYDQRGFGLSGGNRSGSISIVDLRLDLSFVIKSVFKDSNLPITLIGNGVGGVVAVDFMLNESHKFNKLNFNQILINPLLNIQLAGMAKLNSFITKRLHLNQFLNHYNVFEHNSNIGEAEKLLADPLAKKEISPKFFDKLKERTDELKKNLYFLEEKTLFLIGAKGKICDNYVVKLFNKAMPAGQSEVIEYKNSGHELLFDKQSQEVIEDMLAWFKKV